MTYREKLGKKELDNLDRLAVEFTHSVELSLSRIRGESVTLWLKKQDMYKLLKLKVWSQKYRVGVPYILKTLLPFWEQFVQRHSKKMKKQGLNVRVSTLIGKKSEVILQDVIKRDYPNDLQKTLYIATERERLYRIAEARDSDEFKVKSKSLLNSTSPKQYVTAYRHRIKETQKLREKFEAEMQLRNYRGNPFTPERV